MTEWQIGATVERVWDAILRYADWPAWWKGVVSVELLDSGDAQGIGAVLRQRWRSRLPYTLKFDLSIAHIERFRLLEGRASGDFEGSATWTFEERNGGTHVQFVLDVHPTKWWMSLPVPFAGRVFAYNYDTVMRWGCQGLSRRLEARVAELTPAAPA